MSLYCAVYEEGNIARAADSLFMSHQAVSKRIKGIEAELGSTLFERTVKGITPTKAGQDAYRTFSAMLSSYRSLEARLRESSAVRPVIRLSIEFYDIDAVNLDALLTFEESSPMGARIEVKYLSNMECYRQLLDGRVDIAVTNRPLANAAKFDFVSLQKSRAFIAVSADNPLAQVERLSAEDFEGQTVFNIIDATNTNQKLMETFAAAGVNILVEEVSYDMSSLASMIRTNRGIHIVPEVYTAPLAGKAGIVTRVLPGFGDIFEIGLVRAKHRPLRREIDEFVAFALENNLLLTESHR